MWFAFILTKRYKLKAEHMRVNEGHTQWMTNACHQGPDWNLSQLSANPPVRSQEFFHSLRGLWHLWSESTPRNTCLLFKLSTLLSKMQMNRDTQHGSTVMPRACSNLMTCRIGAHIRKCVRVNYEFMNHGYTNGILPAVVPENVSASKSLKTRDDPTRSAIGCYRGKVLTFGETSNRHEVQWCGQALKKDTNDN